MPPISLFHGAAGVTTLAGIEIVRVGTWNASTGPTRVTEEHLAAMVAAAGDAEVDLAMIKPGHIDPRWDGQPAMGAVRNLRVERRSPGEGAPAVPTLVGDLVNVPAALAEVLPLAWPNRSAEIAWGVVTSRGRYAAALTGLALLGVTPPAVKGLAQVAALYSGHTTPAHAQAFTALSLTEVDPAGAAAGLGVWVPIGGAPAPIRDPGGAGGETVAMPLTEDRLRQLIGAAADVDLEAAVQQLVQRAGPPTAPPAPPPGLPAAPAPQASTGTPPPPATAPAPPAPTAPAGEAGAPPAPVAGTPPPPVAPAGPSAPAAGAAVLPPMPAGMVVISEGVLAQLQQSAARGDQAFATLQAADDERVLSTALSEGRIAPADLADRVVNGATVPGLRTTIRQAPAAVRAMLSSLTPRFATTAIGADLGREVEASAPDAAVEAAWTNLETALGADFGVAPAQAAGAPAQQGGAAL